MTDKTEGYHPSQDTPNGPQGATQKAPERIWAFDQETPRFCVEADEVANRE